MGRKGDRLNKSRVVFVNEVRFFAANAAFRFVMLNVSVTRSRQDLRIPILEGVPLFSNDSTTSNVPAFVTVITRSFRRSREGLRTARVVLATRNVSARGPSLGTSIRPMTVLERRRPVAGAKVITAALLP